MKHPASKPLALCLAVLMILASLTGCGGTAATGDADQSSAAATVSASVSASATESAKASPSESAKPAAPEAVTLEFLAPAPVTSVNDFNAVLDEFYKQTADTLNVKINYTFTTFDDIGQKVTLKLAAGEAMDAAFSAQWTNPSIMQMISNSQLVNLDPYFNSDAYPGLKKAFTPEYLKNNSFADPSGQYHVYGIPFSHSFDGGAVVYYRKDLAEKYGFTTIDSFEALTKYYDAILANEKGMIPFSYLGSVDLLSTTLQGMTDPVSKKHNTITINNVGLAIKEDGTVYAANNVVPSLDPAYNALEPAELRSLDPLRAFKLAREWYKKGYVEKDILSQKDHEGLFMAGKAASYYRGLDTFNAIETRLKASVPGATLGYWIMNPGLRTDTPKTMGSGFKAWNFACIPVTSKNTDRTMAFFNWLYSDMKNHDLFELGLEGKHWTAVGDTKFKIPDGVDPAGNYNFPGYILTWNPTMLRYDSTIPDEVVGIMNKLGDTNWYYRNIDAGFSFVSDNVKTEQAKMNDLTSLIRTVGNGVLEDTAGELAKIQKKFDQAGYAKMKDEMASQFGEFLKNNPYEGQ